MYLESYMSRVLDIPKYRANKDKDKINLVYFIRFIHYKLVSYDKQYFVIRNKFVVNKSYEVNQVYFIFIYIYIYIRFGLVGYKNFW